MKVVKLIENSDDKFYYLHHYENDKVIKEINTNDKQAISNYLVILEKNSSKILSNIVDYEISKSKKEDSKDNKPKIPSNVVKIKIPNFSNKYRIVDTPGLTSKYMQELFFKYLECNSYANIFLYVKK